MVAVDEIYDVRWSLFAATVVLAGLVVLAVVLLATHTLRRRMISRPPRIVGTVVLGAAAFVADAITLVDMTSGGWMLGYIFAVDMWLLGWFLWRLVQFRLARIAPRQLDVPCGRG